jgi:DNA-binding beta-propeller fold protein YncE
LFSHIGNLTHSWNTTGVTIINDSSLETPQGLFIYNNIIYVSDAGTTLNSAPTIHRMPLAGGAVTSYIISSSMSSPVSVYVDAATNVYVPDLDNGCVFKFVGGLASGIQVAAGINGQPGSALNSLDGPAHLAFDSTETYMYIADSNNDRIVRYLATATSGDDGVVVAVSSNSSASVFFNVLIRDSLENNLCY